MTTVWRWQPPAPRTLARWILAIAPFMGWTLWCAATGSFRGEHLVFIIGMPALVLASDATRRLLQALYPLACVGLLYDTMKYVQYVGITPARVHDCDLRAAEARLFGIGGGRTVHDWFAVHHTTALDLLCAVPYGTFIYAVVLMAVYLYVRDFAAVQRYGWTFLLMNVLGFVTYHVYPAAPPWYFHAHGCTVDLGAHAYEGARLAHVDALLGVRYFHGFYGRSHDVFGAIPSLHVAYPLLILREGWRYFGHALRTVAVLYALLMAFGAVYLDHHWILDVCLGVLYVSVAYALARRGVEATAAV